MEPNQDISSVEEARDEAIKWQQWAAQQNLSYAELVKWQAHFASLATTFDLTEEFTENGII